MKKFISFMLIVALAATLFVAFAGCVNNGDANVEAVLVKTKKGMITSAKKYDFDDEIKVKKNANVTLMVGDRADKMFVGWKSDGQTISAEKTFEFVAEDEMTITAAFTSKIDYKTQVKLNTEKYPELSEQGIFVWKANADGSYNEYRTYTDEGKAAFDSSKPTIIFIHGMLSDAGYKGHETFVLADELLNTSNELPDDVNNSRLCYTPNLWAINGWNVLTFQYNKFADSPLPQLIEERIHSVQNGVDFKKPDGTYSENDASDYSISQYFAAEYIRAIEDLNIAAEPEIRIACHSMGGVVTNEGTRILISLANDNQISKNLLPDRIALLDTYCGFVSSIELDYNSIAWSGESLEGTSNSQYYANNTKVISQLGIAIELYVMRNGVVPTSSGDGAILEVMDYAATLVYEPKMFATNMDYVAKGHNAVREWYMCSVVSVAPCLENTATTTLSASASMQTIKDERGKIYYLYSDNLMFSQQTVTVVNKDFYHKLRQK